MEETGEPSPPFAIVLSNLWIAYGFIQTVLERRPGDVHRLVRVVIEFQQVREQKGLCYSIYSYGTCHDDTGYFGVYTALGRETEGQALDTILAVIREPTEHGVTQAELDRAREQSKANVLMGLESAQSHMSSLGRGEVLDEGFLLPGYRGCGLASGFGRRGRGGGVQRLSRKGPLLPLSVAGGASQGGSIGPSPGGRCPGGADEGSVGNLKPNLREM